MNFRMIGCACLFVVVSMNACAGVSGVFDANNVLLGEYAESVSVIHSVQGFRFAVNGDTGAVSSSITSDISGRTYDTTALLYSSANCTGQAYVSTDGQLNPAGGLVFGAGAKGLYYVAKTPVATTTAIASSYNGASCSGFTPALFAVVPAVPNVPATTGVPNTPFLPPLHLEMVPLSQYFRIFQNGFESSFAGSRVGGGWHEGEYGAITARAVALA